MIPLHPAIISELPQMYFIFHGDPVAAISGHIKSDQFLLSVEIYYTIHQIFLFLFYNWPGKTDR